MIFRASVVSVVLILVAGCALTPDIRLQHSQTGQTVTCAGYPAWAPGQLWGKMTKDDRDACVKAREAEGYVITK